MLHYPLLQVLGEGIRGNVVGNGILPISGVSQIVTRNALRVAAAACMRAHTQRSEQGVRRLLLLLHSLLRFVGVVFSFLKCPCYCHFLGRVLFRLLEPCAAS